MSKTYTVVALKKKGSYGVRIAEPNSFPDTVPGFATRADAEAWITRQLAADVAARQRRPGPVKPDDRKTSDDRKTDG